MVLHEFDPVGKCYTGQECRVQVTSMTSFSQPCAVSDEAMNPNFCILSIRLEENATFQKSESAPAVTNPVH